MAAAPTPDPSQQTPQPGAGGTQQQGAPQQGGGQQQPQAGPPPELQALGQVLSQVKQLAQQVPAFSAGLAKALAGINEAASAFMTQPQQQAPDQSPPY